jgi:hypothetical protein
LQATELRHRLTAELLQATEPLSLAALATAAELSAAQTRCALELMVEEGRVVSGDLLTDEPGPLYRWAARWHEETDRHARGPRQEFNQRMAALEISSGAEFDILDEPATAFHDFVIREYAPPRDKRWLVFAQCSVRRPFSTSPSHASIRRAVAAATGFDPGTEMTRCPVHVVVLASCIGPVPYELQETYPANVRGGGIKEFGDDRFARYFPVLADRMADFLRAHGHRYQQMAGFGESRYGHVLRAASQRAGVSFPVLPLAHGPRLTRIGRSTPRKYWEKHWIQLYSTISGWLDEAGRAQAEQRLRELDVEIAGEAQ